MRWRGLMDRGAARSPLGRRPERKCSPLPSRPHHGLDVLHSSDTSVVALRLRGAYRGALALMQLTTLIHFFTLGGHVLMNRDRWAFVAATVAALGWVLLNLQGVAGCHSAVQDDG